MSSRVRAGAPPASLEPEVARRHVTISPERLAALKECERIVELLRRPGATSAVGLTGGAVIQLARKVVGVGDSLEAAAAMACARAAALTHAQADRDRRVSSS